MTSLSGHRDIQAIGVRCTNAESGCDWEGTVGTLEDHVTKCEFTLVQCPNGWRKMAKSCICSGRNYKNTYLASGQRGSTNADIVVGRTNME